MTQCSFAMRQPLQGTDNPPSGGPFSDANIAALRHDMLRFARLQLRDEAAAEDAVQEALTAAYLARDGFAGRSQLKTWVFSILRNKIIDMLRYRSRHPTRSLTAEDGSDVEIEQLFNEKGMWHKQKRPTDWGDPETELDNQQFWHIFELCLSELAEQPARVFSMREFLGFETAEICAQLEISESNCWVILHRARSRLRLCLEKEWFAQE
ncbi:MAG: sigma-70 family RNA polymerase sigma factor [Thiohalophilus sp.]